MNKLIKWFKHRFGMWDNIDWLNGVIIKRKCKICGLIQIKDLKTNKWLIKEHNENK